LNYELHKYNHNLPELFFVQSPLFYTSITINRFSGFGYC